MGHEKSRKELIEEYERGSVSLRELSERYGISSSTLHRWVKAHERGEEGPPSGPTRRFVEGEMPNSVAQLQRELKEARLEAKLYKTMVEVAEKELGIPIRKKSGAK